MDEEEVDVYCIGGMDALREFWKMTDAIEEHNIW